MSFWGTDVVAPLIIAFMALGFGLILGSDIERRAAEDRWDKWASSFCETVMDPALMSVSRCESDLVEFAEILGGSPWPPEGEQE